MTVHRKITILGILVRHFVCAVPRSFALQRAVQEKTRKEACRIYRTAFRPPRKQDHAQHHKFLGTFLVTSSSSSFEHISSFSVSSTSFRGKLLASTSSSYSLSQCYCLQSLHFGPPPELPACSVSSHACPLHSPTSSPRILWSTQRPPILISTLSLFGSFYSHLSSVFNKTCSHRTRFALQCKCLLHT